MTITNGRLRSLGALSAAGLTAVVIAQAAPALDVKFGLWEMTATVDVGGAPPAMDTSKMTPEQKAKMDAAMKGMMGQHTSTDKQCLTRDDLAKAFSNSDDDETCKDTVATNATAVYDVKHVCTGDRTSTSQIHVEAVTREGLKGTVKSTVTEAGRTQTVNVSFTGKWLAADCGNLK